MPPSAPYRCGYLLALHHKLLLVVFLAEGFSLNKIDKRGGFVKEGKRSPILGERERHICTSQDKRSVPEKISVASLLTAAPEVRRAILRCFSAMGTASRGKFLSYQGFHLYFDFSEYIRAKYSSREYPNALLHHGAKKSGNFAVKEDGHFQRRYPISQTPNQFRKN